MKKMVFIACALMVLGAGSAMAAGANLAWNDCVGGGGVFDRTAVCANTGSGTMYVSFVVANSIPNLAASDCFTDVEASSSVSSWWFTVPIGTRWGHASTNPASGACPGWFDGAANGPIAFAPTAIQTSPSRLRLRTSIVIAAGEEQPVDPGIEYASGAISLKNSAGTGVAGSPANTECNAGGAIGIVDLVLSAPGSPDTRFQAPDVRDCVTFRGGGGKVCPAATPTKKATWGSIKALYR